MADNKEFIENIAEETASYSDDSLFNISSFGTDISFRELITMYEEGDLEKPEMQRRYVWQRLEASRFIDSILLGLPVPSIFLAKTEDEKRLIVDGYQRIMTVYDYVKRGVFGGDGKSFSLSNTDSINEKWRGKTFAELQPDEQRKIRNSPIHAIVFEQKEPKDDTGMYQIFERINTSGRSLKPQEIRNCVYHGKFNKFLLKVNENVEWRKVWGSEELDSRMADVELVLRAFAFEDIKKRPEISKNQISLAKYLNSYMKAGNQFDDALLDEMADKFAKNMAFISVCLGENAFRNGKEKDGVFSFAKKINPAIMDSVYVATDYYKQRIPEGNINIVSKYKELLKNPDYQLVISSRTTSVENIKKRINIACEILYGVKYEW